MKKHCIKVLFSKVNFNELHRITYQFLWNFTKRIVDFPGKINSIDADLMIEIEVQQ